LFSSYFEHGTVSMLNKTLELTHSGALNRLTITNNVSGAPVTTCEWRIYLWKTCRKDIQVFIACSSGLYNPINGADLAKFQLKISFQGPIIELRMFDCIRLIATMRNMIQPVIIKTCIIHAKFREYCKLIVIKPLSFSEWFVTDYW